MTAFVVTLWNLAQMICSILTIAAAVIDGVLAAAETQGKIESEELDTVRSWLSSVGAVCAILEKVVF
jgi:hypothetical protein